MILISYKQGAHTHTIWVETNNKIVEVLQLLNRLYTDVKTHIKG